MIRGDDRYRRILVGARAIDECGPQWAALVDQLDSPVFQTPDWARTWLHHFGGHSEGGARIEAEPWILVREGSDPYIWPLIVTRRGPYRVLRSLGEGVSDYLGPISADPAAAMRDALELLKRGAGMFGHIDLKSLAVRDEALAVLETGLRGATRRVYERCPNIRTDGTFAGYLEGRKKKFRANWKRTIRRTEAHGKVDIGLSPFSDDLFAEIQMVERESWKWANGTAYLSDPRRTAFLCAVLSQPRMQSEIWTCRIDGALAAFAIAFTNRTTRHYYLPSFRTRYSDVGTYLLGRIAEATFDSELTELDLMQGDESYKMAWATGERSVYELAAPGVGPIGWPAVLGLKARWRLAESSSVRELRVRLQRAVRGTAQADEAD